MNTADGQAMVEASCPQCGGHEIVELFSTRLAYPVEGVADGEPRTSEAVSSDGDFDGFKCSTCFYESSEISDFVAPDPEFVPTYEPWRHGGWYVHGVRHKNGGIGCVSRNYPDRKWRIVCDSRGMGHTYKDRDEAARAEYALTSAGVIE